MFFPSLFLSHFLPSRSTALIAALMVFASIGLLPTGPASATTITVTSTADPGDGTCTGAGIADGCTLREAIAASNSARDDDDIIVFAPGVTGIINLAGVLPDLSRITLSGPGANQLTVQRDAGGQYPIFRFRSFAIATLSGLTIKNGDAGTDDTGLRRVGGGIQNLGQAKVTVNNCTLSNNTGGAIFNNGFMTLTNSTLRNNSESGGILNLATGDIGFDSATLIATNCTFSGNSNTTGGPGGISNRATANVVDSRASLYVTSCTFSNNICGVLGGASDIANAAVHASHLAMAIVEVGHTIFQGDGGTWHLANSGGSFNSRGYNLSDDNGSGFLDTMGDRSLTDAKLDPNGLRQNGGPTPTIALLPGSLAVNGGDPNFKPPPDFDQRGPGFPRVARGRLDIGAFELHDTKQSGPTFTVNTNDDSVNTDDGVCGTTHCTLREAIGAANDASGANTIVFADSGRGTITLTRGELSLTGSTTVQGPGARLLAVSGNSASRIFSFAADKTSLMSGLTLRDGGQSGLLIGATTGGGVFNQGTLTLTDCTLSNNGAHGGNALLTGSGGSGNGGAIYNAVGATLTLNRCTLSGNSATGGKGADASFKGGPSNGGNGSGGAIYNAAGASLTIKNCTFFNNSASGGPGGNGDTGAGGGAGNGAVFNQGTLSVTACTLSGNQGTGGAGGTGSAGTNGAPGKGSGGLSANGGASTVRNTISVGNSGDNGGGADMDGPFTSLGYNLIGNGSSFSGPGDQIGVTDAKLGPLQDNGGPTDTMALLIGSPALDKGKAFGLTTDQRGQVRPFDDLTLANANGGDGSDIGAFEDVPPGFLVSGRCVKWVPSSDFLVAEKKPLAGASVKLKSGDSTVATATSDANGFYHFTSIVNGSYTVEARLTTNNTTVRVDPLSPSVTVNSADVEVPRFNLYSIFGKVKKTTTDGSQVPLAGATVTLTFTGTGTTRTVTSDANGVYRFNLLSVGSYSVKATLSGFSFTAKSVTLPTSGQPTSPAAKLTFIGTKTSQTVSSQHGF